MFISIIVSSKTLRSARSIEDTPVGAKYLCAVIKWEGEDKFLLTAYFTSKPRKGDELWRMARP